MHSCPICGQACYCSGEDDREETCFKCKRVYVLHDEITVTHYTRPLDELAHKAP